MLFRPFTCVLTLTLPSTKALETEPSLIAYIAKSLAHVGNGGRDKGYRACDIASVFLLIEVCVFVLGFLILLRSLRPSPCLWRESSSMGSHAWTTLLLLSATTWSRCVYDALLRVE